MGFYINPPDMSKEDFLTTQGTLYDHLPMFHRDEDLVTICLVDNGAFTAAAICYNQDEYEVFEIYDGRPKKWFGVNIEKLAPYINPELIETSSITKGRRGKN